MKKLIISATLIAGLAVSVSADVNIDWNSVFTDPVTTDGTTPVPNSYLAALIYSDDNIIDPLNPADPLGPSGNDVVLTTQPVNAFPDGIGLDGLIVGAQTPYVFANDNLAGGYVYTRVFSSSAPTVGDLYGESSMLTGPLTVTTNDPTTLNSHQPVGVVVNMEIIPEPTTLALLLVGFGTVLFRRRR